MKRYPNIYTPPSFEIRDHKNRSPFLAGYIVGASSVALVAAFAWVVSLLV